MCLTRSQSFRTRREHGRQQRARRAVRGPVMYDSVDVDRNPSGSMVSSDGSAAGNSPERADRASRAQRHGSDEARL